MARARNIKPSFFANDDLADINPLGRLLFIGLWTLCDREGRLEDRPRRIKAEALPYDECDIDSLLNDLEKHGFIQRYAVGEDKFIQVVNFTKHQNPHVKESASLIPALDKHGASTVQDRNASQPEPEHAGLIPDSPFPLTDSPSLNSESGNHKKKKPAAAQPVPRTASLSVADLQAQGVDEQVAVEFLAIRKKKRAPLTDIALAGIKREAAAVGWTLDQTLRKCIERGWQGFEAAWVKSKDGGKKAPQAENFKGKEYVGTDESELTWIN